MTKADEETAWPTLGCKGSAHEYDTRLGRRWNLDPIYTARESRYVVNSDNPIVFKDPNGDFRTWAGAFLNRTFSGGGGKIQKDEKSGEYFIGKQLSGGSDGVIRFSRKFDADGRSYGIKRESIFQGILDRLNRSWMNHHGNTMDEHKPKYDDGYGEVWTSANGQGQEDRQSKFVGPRQENIDDLPGANAGGSPGVSTGVFKYDGVRMQFNFSDIANSIQSFTGGIKDIKDYISGDKPLLRPRSVIYHPDGGMSIDMRPGTDTNGVSELIRKHDDSLFNGQIKIK